MARAARHRRQDMQLVLPPPKHDMGRVLHDSFRLLGRHDYREVYLSNIKDNTYKLTAYHLPDAERLAIADCLDYLYELTHMADSYVFEPVMDGMVPDLRMFHHNYAYVIEIKTVWRAMPHGAITKKFSKGTRQVAHGMAKLRQLTGGSMAIFGHVLAFVIYGDGSPTEVIWHDVAPYVPA